MFILGLDGAGMIELPRLWYLVHLRLFAVLNLNDQLKTDYFSRLSLLLSRKVEKNRSVLADLNWMDQYTEHNLSNSMNRGMTTSVEKLCDKILAVEENESTSTCWSIKRKVLQKTNRTQELALIEQSSKGAIDG